MHQSYPLEDVVKVVPSLWFDVMELMQVLPLLLVLVPPPDELPGVPRVLATDIDESSLRLMPLRSIAVKAGWKVVPLVLQPSFPKRRPLPRQRKLSLRNKALLVLAQASAVHPTKVVSQIL